MDWFVDQRVDWSWDALLLSKPSRGALYTIIGRHPICHFCAHTTVSQQSLIWRSLPASTDILQVKFALITQSVLIWIYLIQIRMCLTVEPCSIDKLKLKLNKNLIQQVCSCKSVHILYCSWWFVARLMQIFTHQVENEGLVLLAGLG